MAGSAAVVGCAVPTDPADGQALVSGVPTIAWHGCWTGPEDGVGAQLDAAGAQCGEVVVPLDFADPGRGTLSVAVARRPAGDPTARLGTLVVNTGGPGPSREGVAVLAQGSAELAPHGQPELAARFDLVGVDPRFFGASTPLGCDWPTDLAFGNIQTASPDRASFEASAAAARALAERCAAVADRLPFASTRDIARDLDLVRAALGEQRVSYLGWSYGGYLGAVYMQMFPDRVERIVLDSPIAPQVQGPALTRGLAPANAAALRDWAVWAAAHDTGHRLGDTAEDVLATVEQIRAAADRHPLTVGDQRVTAQMLPGLLLTAVDSEEFYAAFSARVAILRDAAQGRAASPAPDLAGLLALFTTPDVLPELGLSATAANQCADRAAERDPEVYYRDIQDHLGSEPLFGPLFRRITPCAFWPVHPVEPATVIDVQHPALVVGASGDPAAPHPGQLAMHRALPGSQMITLDGAFRHGVYLAAAEGCVDHATTDYLLEGALPEADRTCPAG